MDTPTKRRLFKAQSPRKKFRPNRNLPPRANQAIARKGEVKYKDFAITFPTASDTSSATNIALIDQGSGIDERIGNRVHVLGVDIDGQMGSSGPSYCIYLCHPLDDHTPNNGDFNIRSPGVPLKPTSVKEHLRQQGGTTADGTRIKLRQRFKYPLQMDWVTNEGNLVLRNKIYVLVTNFNAFSLSPGKATARIYYQDP